MHGTDNRAHSSAGKASLTVEASLAFSLFFFSIYVFWQCFLLIFFELSVADGVGEAAKNMEKIGYAERKLVGADADKLAVLYLPELLAKVETPDFVQWRIILCTAADDGGINIIVRYNFICSAPFFTDISLPVHQAFKIYPFIGDYDEGKSSDDKKEEQDDDDIVYITKNGTVYHESKNCTYLHMSISAVNESEVSKERNKDGGKYRQCSDCADCNHTGLVFVTDYGDCYHYSVNCPNIYRDIIEIKRSEVGNRKPCSKCGGGY